MEQRKRATGVSPVGQTIQVRAGILGQLLAQARAEASLECCGLLAGRGGVIERARPAVNALASATEYEIAPAELFRMLKSLRAEGLELLGIYHSHPATENSPSERDIERAYYPGTPYFIISPALELPRAVRAFLICDGSVSELRIETV